MGEAGVLVEQLAERYKQLAGHYLSHIPHPPHMRREDWTTCRKVSCRQHHNTIPAASSNGPTAILLLTPADISTCGDIPTSNPPTSAHTEHLPPQINMRDGSSSRRNTMPAASSSQQQRLMLSRT